MKRKLLLLSVLVICAATFAVGTLAYFSAEDTAHNVITTGAVKIKLLEWGDQERQTPFSDPDGILPGMRVTKIAEVQNTGDAEAWVRVKIAKTIRLAGTGNADLSLVTLDLNTAEWTQGEDGWLYCNRAAKPGEVTAAVFTTVTFDRAMGNEYQNAAATVAVIAQAVQTANNGRTAQEARGWPTE